MAEVRDYRVVVLWATPGSTGPDGRTTAYTVRAYSAEDAGFQAVTQAKGLLPAHPLGSTTTLVSVGPSPCCEICRHPATCTRQIPGDDPQPLCDDHCDHPPGCERLASEVIG